MDGWGDEDGLGRWGDVGRIAYHHQAASEMDKSEIRGWVSGRSSVMSSYKCAMTVTSEST